MITMTRRMIRRRQQRLARTKFLKGLRASFVMVMVIVIPIYMLKLPLTSSFFYHSYEAGGITVTVTEGTRDIAVVVSFNPPQEQMVAKSALAPVGKLAQIATTDTEVDLGPIVAQIFFDSYYDTANIDFRTVQVDSEAGVIPFQSFDNDQSLLSLVFDRSSVEPLLGHGLHTISVTEIGRAHV